MDTADLLHLAPPSNPRPAPTRHVDPEVEKLRNDLANAIAQRNLFHFQCQQNQAIVEGQQDEIRRPRAMLS